jgi:hypothetical protein
MLHRDSTIQKCFKVRRFSVLCQPSGRCVIPSGHTSVNCSIRPDDVPYRLDARQTKHHPFERRAFSSGPSTGSRSLCPAYICPDDSGARPDASLYLTSFRFFPSSNKGKIDQPSGRCGIPFERASPLGKNHNSNTPVRTPDSFGPDARSSNKEIVDSTSTVRTTSYRGPDTRTSDMEISC